jgi:hypothetical protein
MSIGSPDWGPQTALVREELISFNTAIRVGPGATQVALVSPTKTGYAVFFSVYNFTGNVNAIPIDILVEWLDPVTPAELGQQRWKILAGNAANPHVIEGHGPCETGNMKISVTNHHATDTASFTLDVADISQDYAAHDWRSVAFETTIIPSYNAVPSDIDANVAALLANVGVANGQSPKWILPLYAGLTTWSGSEAPTQGSNIQIVNEADSLFAAPSIISLVALGLSTQYAFCIPLILPRTQCSVQVANFGGANGAYWTSIVADRR